jgi:hypothetical protein
MFPCFLASKTNQTPSLKSVQSRLNMSKGRLTLELEQRKASLVGINDVKFLVFPIADGYNTLKLLGANGLSACSVVVVASSYAALLAHIGPNIEGDDRPDSFIRLAEHMMSEIERLYNEHKKYFPPNIQRYVIVATINGQVLTDGQRDVMINRLKAMGLPDPAEVHRPIQPPTQSGPLGTVMVSGIYGAANSPEILLEDVPLAATSTSVVPSSSTAENTEDSWYWLSNPNDGYLPIRRVQQSGTVVDSRDVNNPPLGVWIYRVNQPSKPNDWVRWDGSSWHQNTI